MRKYDINLVGSTGTVGHTFLNVLAEERFPVGKLRLFASAASNGKSIAFKDEILRTEKLTGSLPESDFTVFATDVDVSEKYVPAARKTSAFVIDNSSAFRADENVPLVIPEINFESIGDGNLIANPNCSTAICALPVFFLKKRYGLKRLRFFTYQSVSGSGKSGIEALYGNNDGVYAYDIRKTCIPCVGKPAANGYTTEENKMRDEITKILGEKIPVSATCVRVPVRNCHAVTVSVVLASPFELDDVRKGFAESEGVVLKDDLDNHVYPVATEGAASNNVYVGRIRRDAAEENALVFYALSDNLRRGAAYNVVRIMQRLIEADRV